MTAGTPPPYLLHPQSPRQPCCRFNTLIKLFLILGLIILSCSFLISLYSYITYYLLLFPDCLYHSKKSKKLPVYMSLHKSLLLNSSIITLQPSLTLALRIDGSNGRNIVRSCSLRTRLSGTYANSIPTRFDLRFMGTKSTMAFFSVFP